MSTYSINIARPEDISHVLFFIQSLAEYEKLQDSVVANEELLYHALFVEKSAHCVLGWVDGKPIAFAIYFFNFSTFLARKGLYLEDLYVLPAYRGKGFGKQLLLHLVSVARNSGCGRMEWSVLDWNSPAIAFYQQLGAKPMQGWHIYRLDEQAMQAL